MKVLIPSMLLLINALVLTSQAGTIFLKDGSVLTGVILDETERDLVLANDHYGELIILKAKVIYRDSYEEGMQTESFAVTPDCTAVVARLQRAVPQTLPSGGSINQLIPGDVQSIITLKGKAISFDKHLIADNSLISIDTSQIPDETEWIILTSLQTTDITELTADQKCFRLKYQLNEKSHLKVVVKLPASVSVQSITPEPQFQSGGLIIWDRTLERQQIFQPEIVWAY